MDYIKPKYMTVKITSYHMAMPTTHDKRNKLTVTLKSSASTTIDKIVHVPFVGGTE